MTDRYWARLAAAFHELETAGPDHSFLQADDPELVARLDGPAPEEGGYVAPTVKTTDVELDHGTGTFPVRIYTPEETARSDRPLFVWAHGGAWAAGDLEGPEADASSREICARADSVVVSVDYRLATNGVHYPIPLDDVVTAFRWAVEHADDLGADPYRVTLGGASAGGNLAAGAALRLRDTGGPTPARVALVYPALHAVLPPPSAELESKLAGLNATFRFARDIYEPIVENYLGAPADQADGYAMPGVAADLTGLPPTLIVNNEYDGLRASGETFAAQLRAAGVEVGLSTVAGVAHGHLARPGLAAAARTFADLAQWVAGATR